MGTSSAHREAVAPPPTPEEAAAIVAALERFLRATAAPATAAREPLDGWRTAAAFEAVEREPGDFSPTRWLNT